MIAKLLLAWAFLVHLIKRFVFRQKSGAERFLQNYQSEGLGITRSVDKDWLLRFSQCFNCGLCDAVCPALGEFPREKFPGPSYLLTTLTRSSPDFWATEVNFSMCQSCARCQEVCPNQVPVKEAIEYLEAKTHG